MKKWIALLLSACLLLSVAGCKKAPEQIKDNGTNDSQPVTPNGSESNNSTDTPVVKQLPMVSISLPTVTESVTAENGTVIFEYTSQQAPSMIVPDPNVAEAVINDFLNRIDSTTADKDSIQAAAENSYSGKGSFTPYIYSITYAPQRIDFGVLSLLGTDVRYTGGNHASSSGTSVSYDLITGKVLTLGDILKSSTSADTICQLVLNALTDLSAEITLYKGYEETVADRFSGKLSENEAWYLSQTGLCFYFSPYEIAPYSAGVVVVEIPYEKLTGIMEDAYFPAERDTVSGTVGAIKFDIDNLQNYTQFSEVIMEEGKDQILLRTDKSVYDLRIESGIWSASGKIYTPMYTVFAAHTLTPGDAVLIESALTESAPALRLKYKTGNSTVEVFIVKASDGSVKLISG